MARGKWETTGTGNWSCGLRQLNVIYLSEHRTLSFYSQPLEHHKLLIHCCTCTPANLTRHLSKSLGFFSGENESYCLIPKQQQKAKGLAALIQPTVTVRERPFHWTRVSKRKETPRSRHLHPEREQQSRESKSVAEESPVGKIKQKCDGEQREEEGGDDSLTQSCRGSDYGEDLANAMALRSELLGVCAGQHKDLPSMA
jgi:hypothetical protein